MHKYSAKMIRPWVESAPDGKSTSGFEIFDVTILCERRLTSLPSAYLIHGDPVVTMIKEEC